MERAEDFEQLVRLWDMAHAPSASPLPLSGPPCPLVTPPPTLLPPPCRGHYEHLTEPDQAEMFADISNFLDTDQLHWTICEAPTIVIGDGA